jgi:hypothetical protein
MDCSTASSSTSSRPFKKSKTILNDIVFFEKDVRRCLTPVFPYAVLYTIEPEFIHIAAVTHCARQPGYWKERLADD